MVPAAGSGEGGNPGSLSSRLATKATQMRGRKFPRANGSKVKDYASKIYVRWKPGDALPPGKLVVARENRNTASCASVMHGRKRASCSPSWTRRPRNRKRCPTARTRRWKRLNCTACNTASKDQGGGRPAGVVGGDTYGRRARATSRRETTTGPPCSAGTVISKRKRKGKTLAAVHVAERKVRTRCRPIWRRCEVRSGDKGRRRNDPQAARRGGPQLLEAVVRLEVLGAAGAGRAMPASVVNVPSQRDGSIVARRRHGDKEEGEKVPTDQDRHGDGQTERPGDDLHRPIEGRRCRRRGSVRGPRGRPAGASSIWTWPRANWTAHMADLGRRRQDLERRSDQPLWKGLAKLNANKAALARKKWARAKLNAEQHAEEERLQDGGSEGGRGRGHGGPSRFERCMRSCSPVRTCSERSRRSLQESRRGRSRAWRRWW